MSAYDELAAAVAEHGPFPMPTGEPMPVELTVPQSEALIDAGNRALNDYYHERQCHCDSWPVSCVSSDQYFMGAWDTDAFAIGLPAVLGVWEVLRNDRHAAKVAELRARVAELESPRPVRQFSRLEEAVQGVETAIAPLTGDAREGADMVLAYLRTLATGGTPPEVSPWERAVAGLNALVDADIAFWIEPDGHISGPFGDEHIEWDHDANRWRLTHDEDDEVHPSHPAPCRVPKSPDCTCPVTPEQARRIERDRPETATSHDCNIPLTRRLDCGHCPHEVCQDCDRCPHTCHCASPEVTR